MTAPDSASAAPQLTVAVIGNPNTGKSTLFTALTGVHSRIGNYPGVTVEKKTGRFTFEGRSVQLVDLPGTYSLSPRSLDEMVSVEVLLGQQRDVGKIDAVVCIADASNLERNLYVVSQVLDLGLPTVLVLNMWDVAEQRGIVINVAELRSRLNIPVIPCEAHRRRHIEDVKQAIVSVVSQPPPAAPRVFPPEFYDEGLKLQSQLAKWGETNVPFYVAERLLLDVGGQFEATFSVRHSGKLPAALSEARERLKAIGLKVPAAEAKARYAWARQVLSGAIQLPTERAVHRSDGLDRWLTHKVWGLAAFMVIMFAVFQAISTFSAPLMQLCEALQQAVGSQVGSLLPPGPFRSLIVDGVIAGVGGILVFLPQICFLFLFIALLEDCGYMARAAFLMDKLMVKVGLSGKSFVPLMSSFACAIPGIMATRTIENRRDRMVTILVAPLMSCSARAPVYALMIAAFFPSIAWVGGWITLHGVMMFVMTFFGAAVAIPVAWLFKKTLFKGETPPFVMELPSYKWPSPRIVAHRVYDRARAFVLRAGTLIFATSILVWAAGYFPESHAEIDALTAKIEAAEQGEYRELLAEQVELKKRRDVWLPVEKQNADRQWRKATHVTLVESIIDPPRKTMAEMRRAAEAVRQSLVGVEAQITEELVAVVRRVEPLNAEKTELARRGAELLEQSYLGRVGKLIEPAVRPLGWDWRIGVGVLASFPAREVIVATLGTIYSLGGDVDETDSGLQQALQNSKWPDGRPVYSIPVALSIMVFFALCAQCASTLMVIRRETNSWGWPLFTFVYMTTLAYLAALIVYQVGMAISG